MKTGRRNLILLLLLLGVTDSIYSQSCANYAVSRATGIPFISFAGNSPSYFAWRNTSSNQNDDNRSFPEPIGFDFWYLGVRYTHFSTNLNGTIDFSSSLSDGNNGGTGPYGPNYNNSFSSAGQTMVALAPLYDDLWTAGSGSNPLATSIFYKTTGSAPNRVLTIEWANFDKWNSSSGSISFQVNIHETTGVIEFIYGAMTQGSAAFSYTCGLNGTWASGAPTAAVLLSQQVANSTSFSSTPKNNLSVLPASNSKLTFTPPTPNGTPTNLTFSAVAKTSLTLNWTDNASNEVGYAVYFSTDGVGFHFAAETGANATSVAITGLNPGTNYTWRVFAVTEGNTGTAITGTQPTLPAGIIKSVATGNWSSAGTWDCNCIPTLGDDVTIRNGHNVTLNANGSCNMLEVGQGTSGQLIIGNNGTARTLIVDSGIVIHPGGVLTIGANPATHSLIVDDHIINNGTLNLAPTSSRVCNVIFSNAVDSDQIVSGTGIITQFNNINVNLSLGSKKVEIIADNFSAASNFLTLTKGIFKLSSPATIVPFTGDKTIPIETGLWVNHSGATVSTTGGSITLIGLIQLTAGTFNLGDNVNNNLHFDGGALNIANGNMKIAGSLDKLGLSSLTNFTMSGGTLNLATLGSTTAGSAPFSINEVGSTFNMSGGTIVIVKPGAGNLGFVNTGSTNGIVTGGIVQIGSSATTTGSTFLINSSAVIPNLQIANGATTTAQLITNPLTVLKNITINNTGTLVSNALGITLGGDWINNGSFAAGTSTVVFNGSGTQTAGGTSGTTFYNLGINKPSSWVDLSANIMVNTGLLFTSGKISLGSYDLTINATGAIAGQSGNNYVIATGTGRVWQHLGSGTSKAYPVGSLSQYMPVTVSFTAGSTADDIGVRVKDEAYNGGETGTIITNNAVRGTWIIDEAVPGGSNASVTLQWNASMELTGFNRNASRLAHFIGGSWDYGTVDIAATGSNPYAISRSDISSFSPFTVSMLQALPVTWSYVRGYHYNGINFVEWATKAEKSNDHFVVEYSVDGIHFRGIDRIPGIGNFEASIQSYQYKHTQGFQEKSYYRVRQVDLDGRSSYSQIVIVQTRNYHLQMLVMPNPVQQTAILQVKAPGSSTASVVISDASGKILSARAVSISPGTNNISLDLRSFCAGIYLIWFQNEHGQVQSLKVVKR